MPGPARPRTTGRGGARVAVITGCALLAACLAGMPLFVSATASEAVQLQLEQSCPSEAALALPFGDPATVTFLDGASRDLPHTQAPTTAMTVAPVGLDGLSDGLVRRALLVDVEGQAEQVDPPLPELGPDEVAASRGSLERLGIAVGDQVTLTQSLGEVVDSTGQPIEQDDPEVTVTVAAVFDDIPVAPVPTFWCGFAFALEPTPMGDPPTATLLLMSEAGIDQFEWSGWREHRLVDEPLTRAEVTEARDAFADTTARYADFMGVEPGAFDRSAGPDPLTTMVDRAESLADAVARTIAPVRLVGAATASMVLVAAAAMIARERRRELRLLALRGVAPWRSGVGLVQSIAGPVLMGSIIGIALAVVGVRALGPTGELEAAPVWSAVRAVAVGAVVAAVLVATVAAIAGDRFVDARSRRHWWRWVPFELPVVALAVLSARELDSSGGMKMFGVEARGGALLAQAFPQLAIAAGVALLARPTLLALRRLRLVGGRLPRGFRLGARRVVMDAATTTTTMLAVALATGSFVVAGILAASADRELVDKAAAYIGSDLAVNLNGPGEVPAALADRATGVQRFDARTEGGSIDVLGIDPDTFARAAVWRADAATRPLAALLDEIRWEPGQGPAPVVLVGDDAPAVGVTIVLESATGEPTLEVRGVEIATSFPGHHQGSVMAVVDVAALAASDAAVSHAIWVHDPPADAPRLVADAGARVRSTMRVEDVFDVLSYSAQRWSYAALGAFGILVGITVITLQLLVVEARRDTRRLTDVMLTRMGFRARSLWVASLVELAVPLLLGALIGGVLARLAAEWSVRRLDPLPRLPPPSLVVTPLPTLVAAGVAGVVTTVVLAVATVWSTRRGDPMEVTRGTA